MRKKRTILMLVAVMLLCAMAVSAVAANLAEPAALKKLAVMDLEALPERPEVTVVGNLVTNDGGKTHTGYFELSLRVSAKAFQSAGVVLTYDNTVLHPVDWQSAGTRVELDKRASWDTAAVVHSKGADGLSGKPALTYAEYTTVEGEAAATGNAYLYLGADSLAYTPLEEELVVTVRFEVEKDEAGNLMAIDMPEAGVSRPSYTVDLTRSAAILSGSVPGVSLMTSAGPGEDSGSQEPVFYTSADDPDYTVIFVREDGPSVSKSGSIASGDYAITFFDWDGRVIDAISSPEDAAEAVAAWEQHAVIQARLGNKPGYKFDKWLVVYEDNDGEGLHTVGGTFTSNNEPLDLSDATVRADVADLSDISRYTAAKDPESKSVLLQASYSAKTVENGDTVDLVNGGGMDNTDRYYTISEPVFTRYGAADAVAGSYSLTMTVKRRQEDGETGVTRLREPAIWVAMAPAGGGANILNLIRLENTDETTFEIVTTKQISSVTYKVIDVYGISNWPGCADRSDVTKGVRDRNTCITRGTQGYLAEQAYSVYQGGTWEATVNNWAFADCYYNNGTQSGKAAATWWTDARCNTAKSRLLTATQTKGAKLTYAEVLTALGGVS